MYPCAVGNEQLTDPTAIRQEDVGRLAHDLGFERQVDDTYLAHISEHERRHGCGHDWLSQSRDHSAFDATRLPQKPRTRAASHSQDLR